MSCIAVKWTNNQNNEINVNKSYLNISIVIQKSYLGHLQMLMEISLLFTSKN